MARKAKAPVENEAPQASEYQVIHLKYRPQTISEVVGQRSVVRQLQGDIRDGRVGTAYLFTGPRGVGKTSMARIFAKALNCEQGPTPEPCGRCVHCLGIANDSDLDVIEVDAATYTKKDETVELLEGIDRAPFNSRHKVYIIDEVHMFSVQSFNVLLKRLEEPPPHVVFILATTNPEKIPETVISRCRRLEFERMDTGDIVGRLSEIADREGVQFEDGEREKVLEAIALSSEGGMRDSQVALDQLISLSEGRLSLEAARQLLGIVESDLLHDLLEGMIDRDTTKCLLLVRDLVEKGRDLQRFIKTFTVFLRDAMMLRAGAPEELLKVTRANPAALRNVVSRISFPALMNYMQQFLELEEKMRTAAPARFLLEFTIIKLTAIHPRFVLDQLENTAGAPPLENSKPAPAPRSSTPPAPSGTRAAAASKPLPPITGGPVYTGHSPQAALLRESDPAGLDDLPEVLVGEESYPAPEVVPGRLPNEQELHAFRDLADRQLSASVAVLHQCEVFVERPDTLVITVPARIHLMASMLERSEHTTVLRRLAREQFGAPYTLRFVVGDAEAAPAIAEDIEEIEAPVLRELPPMAEVEEEIDEPLSAPAPSQASRPANIREAMARFPDFKEAIELIRKHCGAEPVLYNGQRI